MATPTLLKQNSPIKNRAIEHRTCSVVAFTNLPHPTHPNDIHMC
jgi:hypothetical protein